MIVLGIGPVRLGTWATMGNLDPLAIGSWAVQIKATTLSASACRPALRAKRPSTMRVLSTGPVRLGTWATTSNPDPLAIESWAEQVLATTLSASDYRRALRAKRSSTMTVLDIGPGLIH